MKYFKGKALSDRAQDFSNVKESLDQTVSLLRTTDVGLSTVSSIYKQMKGLLQSAKTADTNGIADITKQCDNLLDQANSIAQDASYQGKALVQPGDPTKQTSGTGPVTQQVSYDDPTKTETIKMGLLPPVHDTYWYATSYPVADNFHIDQATLDTAVTDWHTEYNDGTQGGGPDYVQDPSNTWSTAFPWSGFWAVEYDSNSNQYQVLQNWPVGGAQHDAGMMLKNVVVMDHKTSDNYLPVNPITPPPPTTITLPDSTKLRNVVVIHADVSGSTVVPDGTYEFVLEGDKETQPKTITQQTRPEIDYSTAFNSFADPASIANAETACDNSISYVQSLQAYYGGKNTAIMNRMDFGAKMINTMEEGSGKLMLADLNEESANLVALQTRQQISIQSISIAGQSQSNILALMNK